MNEFQPSHYKIYYELLCLPEALDMLRRFRYEDDKDLAKQKVNRSIDFAIATLDAAGQIGLKEHTENHRLEVKDRVILYLKVFDHFCSRKELTIFEHQHLLNLKTDIDRSLNFFLDCLQRQKNAPFKQ